MKQALNHLFTKDYFDICTVNTVLEIVGMPRGTEAHKLLSALHCVHYGKMDPELRNKIPHLVNECMRPVQQATVLATDVALNGVEI